MKRLFTLLVLLLALCVSSCSYNDSAIWGKITEMEKEQNEMQEQLDAQQKLLDALANNLTITAVTQTGNGYTITFSDGTSITIKDGEKGDKGDKGEQGDSFIESIVVGEEYVTFTLADGTVIVIPLGSGGSSDGENNKIYYTTTDGKKLFPNIIEPTAFGAIIVSNIYKDGIGVITFDDEVTLIGEEAFRYCNSLTSVTIPYSVTTIGGSAFYACSSLTEFKGKFASEDGRCLIIDGTLNSFAPAGVTEYTIPDSVTEIGMYAFENCSSLTSITIPDSVTTIGYEAFYKCSSLTSVTIPDSVTTIGDWAFEYCSSLESVYCKPTTPPSIGNSVFNGNTSGRKIYVPAESVAAYQTSEGWRGYATNIVGYNFETGEVIEPTTPYNNQIWYTTTNGMALAPYYTTGFGANLIDNTYVNGKGVLLFDGNVTAIGEEAFYECSSLTSITIPDSVTEIGDYAFSYCSSLTSITIPDSVTAIGRTAFYDCRSLTSITIPDSVTEIGDYTFYECSSLTSITIPDSVTTIGYEAFAYCSSLTSVTLPDSVTTIEDCAFYVCSSLTSVTIPDSVTTIGEYAFNDCDSLTSVTIPDSVTAIGNFAFKYCSSLESVYCKPTTPPSIGYYDVFYNNASGRKIYVPAESVAAYQTAEGWSDYADSIVGYNFETGEVIEPTTPYNEIWYTTTDGMALDLDNTTGFGANLVDNTYIDGKGVLLFDGDVTTIGEDAFYWCSSLTSITIPDSVTAIGTYAFYECSSLESVYCKPTTPPSIGNGVFDYNASGRKIYVPAESVAAYQTAEGWSNYASSIVSYEF